MSARRFKLRNGMIVEECSDAFYSGHHNYKVIENLGIFTPNFLSLLGRESDDAFFAYGGAHGADFDIVEEVPSV